MAKIPIKNITARQILDSRGIPTVEVRVEAGKFFGVFGVPSGASTGTHEALELRDGGREFSGKGVSRAVANVNSVIASKLKGMDASSQKQIDEKMIKLDGTPNKSRLGANAILGVSGAVCRTASMAKKVPLYKYIATLKKNKKLRLPRLFMVFIEGGLHGDSNLNFQEYMIVPQKDTVEKSLMLASEVFHSLAQVLKTYGLGTNLGNEGAYSPKVDSNKQALDFLMEAVKAASYVPAVDVKFALDVAASEIYQKQENHYQLSADKTSLSAERLVSMLKEWADKYPIMSIEDGLNEDDWEGWKNMCKRLGHKVLVVGDDLFVTQRERLKKGIENKSANALIIKLNQVGTVTETIETVKLAQENGLKTIVSHRAGETNDSFIADFTVGVGADFIKTGSVARGERVAKYNRLLEIEEELSN